jgi:SAM-dependent methyltransferase
MTGDGDRAETRHDKPDGATLAAYDSNARAFADDWHAQPAPADLHEIVRQFFARGLTADVGCGSGRDVAWLNANGYPAIGYDASEGLLAEARHRHPQYQFIASALPDLPGIADASFINVLCETVLMHLPKAQVTPSLSRMLAILKPAGTLYLSWRVSASDQRDGSGRLYAAIDEAVVRRALGSASIVLDEEVVSASSGKRIHRLVARKAA